MKTNPELYLEDELTKLKILVDKKLLPAYLELCKIKGVEPELLSTRKIPALLDKNFGVLVVTSNERKPRKN